MLGLAAAFALGTLAVTPAPAAAATASGVKVVIVVGPVEGSTSNYIYNAKRYANEARSYGASVTEIYSPNATWAKVKSAAQGANVLIYLGHGNGYPSPYGAFSAYTKDGMGLNAAAGHGNSNTKYYGEYYLRTYIQPRPERRRDPEPAVLRLGQLRAGPGQPDQVRRRCGGSTTSGPASCGPVRRPSSPSGPSSASYTLEVGPDGASTTLYSTFRYDPARNLHYDFAFNSTRTSGCPGLDGPVLARAGTTDPSSGTCRSRPPPSAAADRTACRDRPAGTSSDRRSFDRRPRTVGARRFRVRPRRRDRATRASRPPAVTIAPGHEEHGPDAEQLAEHARRTASTAMPAPDIDACRVAITRPRLASSTPVCMIVTMAAWAGVTSQPMRNSSAEDVEQAGRLADQGEQDRRGPIKPAGDDGRAGGTGRPARRPGSPTGSSRRSGRGPRRRARRRSRRGRRRAAAGTGR